MLWLFDEIFYLILIINESSKIKVQINEFLILNNKLYEFISFKSYYINKIIFY